jgi:hypothetical protein
VRTLGAVLGEVLKEQGGPTLYVRVEATRWRAAGPAAPGIWPSGAAWCPTSGCAAAWGRA